MRPVVIALLSILVIASAWGVGMVSGLGEFRLAGKPASHYFPHEQAEALVRAAAAGDVDGMKAAVEAGADVNFSGFEGIRPLFWALFAENKAGFQALLDLGADASQEAKRRSTVIDIAAGADDPDYLRMLLDHGVDPHTPLGKEELPAIFTAIEQHRWPQLKLLMEYCYNLNWADEFAKTAAAKAALISEMEMAVYLINEGLTHNLQRLAEAKQWNVPLDQIDAQRELIEILKAGDYILPPDPLPPINVYPPPSPPAYAKSCLDRRERLGLGPPPG